MYANVTGFAFLIGMSSAVETLASQQNGAKQYKDVGVTFLRCIFVLGVLSCPIFASWYYVKEIFMSLGVDEGTCGVMQEFMRVHLWSLPADVLLISSSKYLTAMGVMKPEMYTSLLNTFVLAISCWLFTVPSWGGRCGYIGLAWALVLSTYAVLFALCFICWNLKEVRRTLMPLMTSRNNDVASGVFNLQELKSFVAIGLPGCAMTCSEWWAFEILTVFASRLGPTAVAAESIMLQLVGFSFMVPLGIGMATSSVVGNALGAGKKDLAIQISTVSLGFLLFLEVCLIGPLLLLFGTDFVAIFTKDQEVISLSGNAIHIVAVLVIADGMQGVSGSIMRGAGKQMIGAAANLFTYYTMGLPVAWLLCFRANMGISGLLLGILLGAATQGFIFTCLIFFWQSWIFQTSLIIRDPKYYSLSTDEHCCGWDEEVGSWRQPSPPPPNIEGGKLSTPC